MLVAATTSTIPIAPQEASSEQAPGQPRAEQRARDRRRRAHGQQVPVRRTRREGARSLRLCPPRTDSHVRAHRPRGRLPHEPDQRLHPERPEDQPDDAAEEARLRRRLARPRAAVESAAAPPLGPAATGARTRTRCRRAPPRSRSAARLPAARPTDIRPRPRPRSTGGAIHANSVQLTRRARIWATEALAADTALTPMFAPAPAAGELENSSTTGRRRLPRTSPTRPPPSATRKHHAASTAYSIEAGTVGSSDGTAFRQGRPPVGRTGAVGLPIAARSRPACARARSTSSRARSTCSAPNSALRTAIESGAAPLDDPVRPPGERKDHARSHRGLRRPAPRSRRRAPSRPGVRRSAR